MRIVDLVKECKRLSGQENVRLSVTCMDDYSMSFFVHFGVLCHSADSVQEILALASSQSKDKPQEDIEI